MPLSSFHPATRAWFKVAFTAPTDVQQQAWRSIVDGKHTLLAAPTGSGKTLAAFLASIDRLLKEGLQTPLPDETRVLYISPLKALSNDIQINLQKPLQGIRDKLLEQGISDVEIRAWVRTGDTPQAERRKAIQTPPHILVTTPESVYILLTSESGRKLLAKVNTVIVDEIHALAGNKRGSHLTLSLERLQALVEKQSHGRQLQRIGLSATQKPIELMANFLLGKATQDCEIIDTGHVRQRDLGLIVPQSPLEAVMANEVWAELYNTLEHLVQSHRTTLVFVNTRRLAERVTRHLGERLGTEAVMAHHGSMSKERRLQAEQQLKQGKLQCLVATASLELGIDIGEIDLVCQLGSPRSIAAFLQRVGRSGHAIGATPKGRLFPLSRDELVESTALLQAAEAGELDRIIIPRQPLDVLAQQIVAEVSAADWELDALYNAFTRAWPYRELSMTQFEEIVSMLAEGYSTRRGRRAAYLHLDAVNRKVRARRNARLMAITNGGAIPDQFDCDVILQPEGLRIGSVGEDFAFESMPGDIFQLGNASYRILKSETGKLLVEDAKGQPPNIPFWVGEAPGRSDELSRAVSDLRAAVDKHLETHSREQTRDWLQQEYKLSTDAADQLATYLAATNAALGLIPTQKHIVFERFFDEVGDMHFVVHSPFGSRLNRAWGLALRKRFCRKFNFELQAAALEDAIVLSLSSTHSFPMMEVARYLNPKTVREVLIQALLAAPMFPTRWRWNATIALAVQRFRAGRRNPPYFQRSDAEDLVALLFPEQIACGENIEGDREVPDHPLIRQTLRDCLHETMDVEGLEALLSAMEQGAIQVSACDLTTPSPLAAEVITAKPYAFLDDAPAEERRTMAVQSRSFLDPVDAQDLARLDQAAIDAVCRQAWPQVRDADELHDALMILAFITVGEGERGNLHDALGISWQSEFEQLKQSGRAVCLQLGDAQPVWAATERLHEFLSVFPDIKMEPVVKPLKPPNNLQPEDALREILRSRLEGLGPVTADQLASSLGMTEQSNNVVDNALLALEQEGFVIRGCFSVDADETQWCERRLLARIHRQTIKRLRSEIEAVSLSDYQRFLFDWQGLTDKGEGLESLNRTLQQLEGYPVAASLWEKEILPARIRLYTPDMLENLSLTGRISWLRLCAPVTANNREKKQKRAPVSHSPIAIIQRENQQHWRRLFPLPDRKTLPLSAYAANVADVLEQYGALFFADIVKRSGLLRTQTEDALGELVNWGLATADSFAGLRALATPAAKRPRYAGRRGAPGGSLSPFDNAGRWSLIERSEDNDQGEDEEAADRELLALRLLRRYGVLFRKALDRETGLPPWRELLRIYWRLEARGEIRGGRFVQDVSGEQFALPEALVRLRKISKESRTDQKPVVISAADPLNLQGVLLSGEKLPKLPTSAAHRVIYQQGKAIATIDKQGIHYLESLDLEQQLELRRQVFPH